MSAAGLSCTRCTPVALIGWSSPATCWTTAAVESDAASTKPLGLNTPLSDSIASTCFPNCPAWEAA